MTPTADSALRSLPLAARSRSFDEEFVALFKEHYQRIYRYLDRMSNDSDAAEDLAQETFVRLYRRGSMPNEPGAWLISVGMNLLRNMKSSTRRRTELLTSNLGAYGHAAAPAPSDASALESEARVRVRRAADAMSDREKSLLLLRAEGFSYREIAEALKLNVTSVGTLLSRAQRSFRARYEESGNAR
jgi:RNA polymerase sigma-70 factor (ECF subfamily)